MSCMKVFDSSLPEARFGDSARSSIQGTGRKTTVDENELHLRYGLGEGFERTRVGVEMTVRWISSVCSVSTFHEGNTQVRERRSRSSTGFELSCSLRNKDPAGHRRTPSWKQGLRSWHRPPCLPNFWLHFFITTHFLIVDL